jgi:hypothetical protein
MKYEIKDEYLLVDGNRVSCCQGHSSPSDIFMVCNTACAAFEYPSNYSDKPLTATLHCCKRIIQISEDK